jgi:hypothetical protein
MLRSQPTHSSLGRREGQSRAFIPWPENVMVPFASRRNSSGSLSVLIRVCRFVREADYRRVANEGARATRDNSPLFDIPPLPLQPHY